jgi:hypothetical protein
MLVIDRRNDQGTYAPGANRAEVHAQLEKGHKSSAIPAPTETAIQPSAKKLQSGVLCITETPGSNDLLHVLIDRVWGTGGAAN